MDVRAVAAGRFHPIPLRMTIGHVKIAHEEGPAFAASIELHVIGLRYVGRLISEDQHA